MRVIAWTYDPLIRRNAYFNLVKLGARPAEYLPNFYGLMDDAINGGTETDRMLVHWDLRSSVAAAAAAGRGQPAVVRRRAGPGGDGGAVAGPRRPARPLAREPAGGEPTAGGRAAGGGSAPRTLLVGVPADIEAMRISDPAAARGLADGAARRAHAAVSTGARVTGFDRAAGTWSPRKEEVR